MYLICMATMTINVKDDVEKRFRKAAGSKYGKRKGYLGAAITDAMETWMKSENNNVKKAIEMLKNPHNGGGLLYKSRSELHER